MCLCALKVMTTEIAIFILVVVLASNINTPKDIVLQLPTARFEIVLLRQFSLLIRSALKAKLQQLESKPPVDKDFSNQVNI